MLELDPNRPIAAPRPAATIILLRAPGAGDEVELCVMQRSVQSSFMGGAVVFPGGRVEPHDAGAAWEGLFEAGSGGSGVWWDEEGVAARIAACRESLEEVGIAPITGLNGAEDIATLRKAQGADAFRAALRARGARLDLASLVPLSRWVTPEAEGRRFDARFFLAPAPPGIEPVSDDHEAVRVYWASPSALLADFERGEIALFPPTHRTLELLVGARTVEAALGTTSKATLEVICPRFTVEDGNPVLALPGDPAHEVKSPRIDGGSRYVLHDGRWISRSPNR